MRQRKSSNGFTVNAIAGTYVVFLGFDLDVHARNGCLGFAIHRTDKTENEAYWMEGMKTFDETDPGLAPGSRVSSRQHPFQSFQWSDFTAKPEHDYVYRVVPLYGTPTSLQEGDGIDLEITTESELKGTHSVFFNRGAVSSEEYARRFGADRAPNDVGPPAYEWLSRGLLEAFEAFVGRAVDKTFGVYAAIYEFQWPDALEAFKTARTAGATVEVIFDDIAGSSGPKKKNEAQIAAAKIKAICSGRTQGKLMHNKFVVLTKDGKPIAVWTGSTNLTENGIFGHLNCGHIVEDKRVAAIYKEYWDQLRDDPSSAEMRTWDGDNNPAPVEKHACEPVFSPRKGDAVLDWYAQIASGATRALFMTFAFGMAEQFRDVYDRDDNVLRLALMEKEGNGRALAQGRKDIRRIRARPNVIVAVANNMTLNAFDRWLKVRRSLSAEDNVHWIHTKFMLVDPLSNNPIVVTGSANFSKASTDTNDENMMIIRGDTRVADIYFTEYMRLFASYAFREAVAISKEKGEKWSPKSLIDTDAWISRYLKPGQDSLRRVYYSGS